METPESDPVIVAGGGIAGLAAARVLARCGKSVWMLGRDEAARKYETMDWLLAPGSMGPSLPPASILEPSLPVDIVLAGGFRIETQARLHLVSRPALVAAWRRTAVLLGVQVRSVADVRGPLRRDGRVAGVDLVDGTELLAPLTVDATGRGVLAGSVAGAGRRMTHPPDGEREPVAWGRAVVDPAAVQASWVGRAQLLLGLEGGAVAWRCVPRRGGEVLAVAAAGPGHSIDDAKAAVGGALDGLAGHVSAAWRPCCRPLERLCTDGLLVLGSAAAAVDPLTGVDLPHVLRMAEILSVDTGALGGSTDVRCRAAARFQRVVGGELSQRRLVRGFVHGLAPGDREAAVLSGALGGLFWHAAASGGGVLPPLVLGTRSLSRLPRRLRRPWLQLVGRCAAVAVHYRRYPASRDLFELDRWQRAVERLFEDQGP